jgi:PKD repeat protein
MKKLSTLFMITLLTIISSHAVFAQVPNTQLRAIDCGKINLTPVAQIACVPVASANLYQWEFRDINTNAVVGVKNTTGIVFSSSMVNFLQWNTQYNCAVRARVGSTFGSFGASCVIGLMQDPAITGVPPTSLRPQFCNSSSLLLTSTVSCFPVPMGTLYEFEFTNVATQQVTSVIQSSTYVTLNNPSLSLQSGQSYEVRTKGFVFNTWSNVTTVCNISIQAPISNVVAGFVAPACEGTALNLTANFSGGIAPISFAWTGPNGFTSNQQNPIVSNASSGDYTVTVTGSLGSGSGTSTTSITINPSPVAPVISGEFDFCPNNVATLDAGPGYDSYSWSNGMQTQTAIVLQPATYTVVVANSFGCTASASVEVAPCSSNVANTQVRTLDCGKINLTPNAQFACNPVANATLYQWEFRNPSTLALYASYISTGIVTYGDAITPALQFNTQYVTRVRAQVAGEWGNYDVLCNIGLGENPAISGVLPTQLRSQFCNITNVLLSTTIACDPVSMGTLYEFEFTDLSNSSVTTAVGPLVYLNLSTVSPALLAGHTYAVRARGFVYNTWSNFGSACNITISNSPVSAGSRGSAPETITSDEMSSTEITAISTEELLAYPNPFQDQSGFIVKSNENKNVAVYLFNSVGQMVWSKQVTTNKYEQFNTQELAPGFYFMSTSENRNNAVKIIKTK